MNTFWYNLAHKKAPTSVEALSERGPSTTTVKEQVNGRWKLYHYSPRASDADANGPLRQTISILRNVVQGLQAIVGCVLNRLQLKQQIDEPPRASVLDAHYPRTAKDYAIRVRQGRLDVLTNGECATSARGNVTSAGNSETKTPQHVTNAWRSAKLGGLLSTRLDWEMVYALTVAKRDLLTVIVRALLAGKRVSEYVSATNAKCSTRMATNALAAARHNPSFLRLITFITTAQLNESRWGVTESRSGFTLGGRAFRLTTNYFALIAIARRASMEYAPTSR